MVVETTKTAVGLEKLEQGQAPNLTTTELFLDMTFFVEVAIAFPKFVSS